MFKRYDLETDGRTDICCHLWTTFIDDWLAGFFDPQDSCYDTGRAVSQW